MGIPGFNSWFSANYGESYVPLESVDVDHLYVDVNGLLHTAMLHEPSWPGFHKRLHAQLNDVLRLCNPRLSLTLAVDGPAPLAKLTTQRQRRKKDRGGAKTKSAKRGKKKAVPLKHGNEAEEASVLSSRALTPGTAFMEDVTTSVRAWAACRLATRAYCHLAIEVSDALVPGEGELKVLGRMQRHWWPSKGDSHAICGGDSDLLLLALTSCVPHLLVLSNPTGRTTKATDASRMTVMSVDALDEVWTRTLLPDGRDVLAQHDKELLLGLKLDLLLLTTCQRGNDYLPALGIKESLWGAHMLAWKEWRESSCGGCEERGTSTPATPNAASADAAIASPPGIVRPGTPRIQPPSLDLRCFVQLLLRVGAAMLGGDGGGGGGDGNGHDDGSQESRARARQLEAARIGKAPPDARGYLHGLVWLVHMYAEGECPDYRYCYDALPPQPAELLQLCTALAEAGDAGASAWRDDAEDVGGASGSTGMLGGTDSALFTLSDFYAGGRCAPAHRSSSSTGIASTGDGAAPMVAADTAPAVQPLPPLANALALLPAASVHLLPGGVRHLASPDPASPLAPLFAECEECGRLKADVAAAAKHATECNMAVNQLRRALEPHLEGTDDGGFGGSNVVEGSAGGASGDAGTRADGTGVDSSTAAHSEHGMHGASVDELSAQLAAALEAASKARVAARAADDARKSHTASQHPYMPFPVPLLLSAVEDLPPDALSSDEQRLWGFSSSTVMAGERWRPPDGCSVTTRASPTPSPPLPPGFHHADRVPMVQVYSVEEVDAMQGPRLIPAPPPLGIYLTAPSGLSGRSMQVGGRGTRPDAGSQGSDHELGLHQQGGGEKEAPRRVVGGGRGRRRGRARAFEQDGRGGGEHGGGRGRGRAGRSPRPRRPAALPTPTPTRGVLTTVLRPHQAANTWRHGGGMAHARLW